jgi:hypothetical protein
MNYPTKDNLQIQSNSDSNTPNNNQILTDPTRDLGSVRDDKFDIATKDNVKDEKHDPIRNLGSERDDKFDIATKDNEKHSDIKDKLNILSVNLKRFLGFVGPGYGKKIFFFFIYKIFLNRLIKIYVLSF